MWYPATVTQAPASEPVTLAEAKAQLQIAVSDTSKDDGLSLYIKAARAWVQNYCGVKLVTQTISATCSAFADFERVAEAPIQSVTAINYVDPAGDAQVLSAAVYDLRKEGLAPSIALKATHTWPSILAGSRIEAVMVAGYETGKMPEDIKLAILLAVTKAFQFSRGDLLRKREVVDGVGEFEWSGAVEVSKAIDSSITALLDPYRNWALA